MKAIYYYTEEAAEFLGLSVRTMHHRRWMGQPPPYIKFKGRIMYRKEDLDAFNAEIADKPDYFKIKEKKKNKEIQNSDFWY